jgi:hypothetical protein
VSAEATTLFDLARTRTIERFIAEASANSVQRRVEARVTSRIE